MSRERISCAALAAAACVVAGVTEVSQAAPYASGVSQSGSTVNFVLNEAADNVVVNRVGDTPLLLGPLAKGTHSFSLGSGTGYDISVSNSAAPGWAQISDDTNTNNKFFSPRGVTVNRNASSPFFGDVYVSNHVGGDTADVVRTTPKGIYRTRADQTPVTNSLGGVSWAATSSPWKITAAPDGQIYIADWSDSHSGVWRAPGDLSGTFPEVLDNTGRATSGLAGNHGSVASVHVEGTGANTVLYTVDEDFPNPGDVNAYPIGNNATPFASTPSKVTTDGSNVLLNGNMDVVRAPDGSWWITQNRALGQDTAAAPGLVRFLDGGTAPAYSSGTDDDLDLGGAGASIAIHPDGDLLAFGFSSSSTAEIPAGRIFLIDISDPTNPTVVQTLQEAGGGWVRDLDFDVAGNLYTVNNNTETLRVYSPGGDTLAITGSDGSFVLVPEPATLSLLGLGALGLLARRRRA